MNADLVSVKDKEIKVKSLFVLISRVIVLIVFVINTAFCAKSATPPCDIVSLPFTWDFTSSLANDCWGSTLQEGAIHWVAGNETSSVMPEIIPFSGNTFVFYDAWNATPPASALLHSPLIDLSGSIHPRLTFYRTTDNAGDFCMNEDYIQPKISVDGGITWMDLGQKLYRYDPSVNGYTASWRKEVIELNDFLGYPTVTIGFEAVSAYGNGMGIDLVTISEPEMPACVSSFSPAPGETGISRNVTFTWTEVENADSYDLYLGTSEQMTLLATVSSTAYTVLAPLQSNTQYYWKIVPRNQYFEAGNCTSSTFFTNEILTYCTSGASAATDEDISRVVFNTIDHVSASFCNRYTDNTQITTGVRLGNSYAINISKTDCEGSGFWGWRTAIYIDFNHNGIFEVPQDLAWCSDYITSQLYQMTVTGNILIPGDALPGPTRMRVVLGESYAIPSPCGEYNYGETEDYSLDIVDNTRDIECVTWVSPVTGCNLSSGEPVTIRYRNVSGIPLDDYVLSYYNGNNWVSESVTKSVLPGETMDYTFQTTSDFSVPGDYQCRAAAFINNDLNRGNDTSDFINISYHPLSVNIPDVNAIGQGANPNTIYLGYGPACLILTTSVSGGTPPYTYVWSTASQTKSVSICAPGIYSVTVTDNHQCSSINSKMISLRDVRCGNNLKKVVVCQVPPDNPENEHTICVAPAAVASLLNSGSYLGYCGSNAKIENDADDEMMFRIYPNPVGHVLFIDLQIPGEKVADIELFDLTGKKIMDIFHEKVDRGIINKLKTDIQQIPEGLYFIKLTTGDQILSRKISLIR